jgi:hypothetical protein
VIAVLAIGGLAAAFLGGSKPPRPIDPVASSLTVTAPAPESTPSGAPVVEVRAPVSAEPGQAPSTSAVPASTGGTVSPTGATPAAPVSAASRPTGDHPSSPAETPLDTPPPAEDDSGPLSVRLTKALEANKTGKALSLAQQLTAQSPGSASAWQLRGAAEQAAGRGGTSSFRKCAELAAPESQLRAECRSLAGM